MQRKSKLIYEEWLFVLFAWFFLTYFFYIIAFWGSSNNFREGPTKNYLDSGYVHLEIILTALILGLLFSLINTFTNKTGISKRSLGYIIAVKSLLYIFAGLLTGMIVYGVFYLLDIKIVQNERLIEETLQVNFFIALILYLVFCILLINFILQINKKFGPGNLFKMIIGRYHKPREEQRIFLFLDLEGSTTIAEQLGHKRYSQLLRNCFHDLTDVVIRYHAEIYQFVGDEVVLSWTIKKGVKTLNCIKTFFAFENKLSERKEFYHKTFQVFPEFRGGMDLGIVIVTEIGDIKREIAYHGDVLNTASRIQDQCKNLKQKLLLSENLVNRLTEMNGFSAQPLGNISLRGKNKPVKIYNVTYLG